MCKSLTAKFHSLTCFCFTSIDHVRLFFLERPFITSKKNIQWFVPTIWVFRNILYIITIASEKNCTLHDKPFNYCCCWKFIFVMFYQSKYKYQDLQALSTAKAYEKWLVYIYPRKGYLFTFVCISLNLHVICTASTWS